MAEATALPAPSAVRLLKWLASCIFLTATYGLLVFQTKLEPSCGVKTGRLKCRSLHCTCCVRAVGRLRARSAAPGPSSLGLRLRLRPARAVIPRYRISCHGTCSQ